MTIEATAAPANGPAKPERVMIVKPTAEDKPAAMTVLMRGPAIVC
jgi:hypothetical protein